MTRTQTKQRLSASVVVGLVLILGFAATTVHAAQPERRVALVIGNADYVSSSDLNNPANDARAMAQKLQSLGFTLVGGEAHVDVTRDGMLGLLDELRGALDAQTSSEAATALVYYSGHGVAEAGSNWLVPVDDGAIQDREDVPERAIGARSVMSRLEGRGGGLNILILDACRNNPLPSRSKTRGALSKGLGRMDAPSNTMIVYAAAPGKVAYDGVGELSPFTGALLSEMDRPGRRLEDVLGATAAAVRKETAGMPRGAQEPWLEMQPLQRPFYFVPPQEDPPPPAEAKNAYETALKENTIAAYQAVVEHFPDTFYATLARGKIEELEAPVVAAERPALRQALARQLGREFSPHAEAMNGWTDLHYAAALDLPGLAESLLDKGAKIDARAYPRTTHSFFHNTPPILRRLGRDLVGSPRPGPTPLHIAAIAHSTSTAKILIDNGADVNALNRDHDTPLHIAAANDTLTIAEYLIDNGADVNALNRDDDTPLHIAADKNALAVARSLVEKGADINATTDFGGTPLNYAAVQDHLDLVQYLIRRGADINARGEISTHTPLADAIVGQSNKVAEYLVAQGADVDADQYADHRRAYTLLHSAVRKGSLPVVRYLFAKGARVNAKHINLDTPLHVAARSGDLTIVEFLVSKGADVNATNDAADTPLHAAARSGNLAIAEFLVSKGADVHRTNHDENTPLHVVDGNNSVGVAQYLVGKGAEVNATNYRGESPLHVASGKDTLTIVQFLMAKGADINAKNKYDKTPLHFAVAEQASSVAEHLISRGANIDSKFKDELLFVAAGGSSRAVIRYLIQQGANVNADPGTIQPLHRAARHNAFAAADYLISQGADVNAKDPGSGETALHVAAEGNAHAIAELLVINGADMDMTDRSGETPLHRTMTWSETADTVAEYLVLSGADITVTDDDGETPLHRAIYGQANEIVKLLIQHGADVQGTTRRGKTPLELATTHDAYEVAEMLVRNGANVMPEDEIRTYPAAFGGPQPMQLGWRGYL